jgi:hypothetical protein
MTQGWLSLPAEERSQWLKEGVARPPAGGEGDPVIDAWCGSAQADEIIGESYGIGRLAEIFTYCHDRGYSLRFW